MESIVITLVTSSVIILHFNKKNSQTTVSIKTKLNRMYFVDPQFMFCFHFSERFIHLFHSTADIEEKIFKNRPIRNKNCLWRHVC
jgi:hypothetical protein